MYVAFGPFNIYVRFGSFRILDRSDSIMRENMIFTRDAYNTGSSNVFLASSQLRLTLLANNSKF